MPEEWSFFLPKIDLKGQGQLGVSLSESTTVSREINWPTYKSFSTAALLSFIKSQPWYRDDIHFMMQKVQRRMNKYPGAITTGSRSWP